MRKGILHLYLALMHELNRPYVKYTKYQGAFQTKTYRTNNYHHFLPQGMKKG